MVRALRAPECGAAFAWLGPHDDRSMRRLAVAAREGRTWGVLWRRPGQHAIASTASLRLSLAPSEGRLAVRVLKRRGGDLAQPVFVDVDEDGGEAGYSWGTASHLGPKNPPCAVSGFPFPPATH